MTTSNAHNGLNAVRMLCTVSGKMTLVVNFFPNGSPQNNAIRTQSAMLSVVTNKLPTN